jgi:hypothetical protein
MYVLPCGMETTTISLDETLKECAVEGQNTHPSILDIHRRVLSRILGQSSQPVPLPNEQSIDSLRRRLNNLKRKRLYLVSELERNKLKLTTVSEELSDESRIRRCHDCGNDNNDDDDDEFSLEFAHRMHALRTRRRIAGSHRIAGISVVPCPDSSLLAIRMDICVNGSYVNRHYLFFQHDANQKLRLVQHTLPQGCSTVDRTIQFDNSMANLRRFIGDIYDACYCHAVRQDACDFLLSHGNVSDLKCSNSLDLIVFSINGCHVQLKFSNLSALPTHVKVSRSNPNPQSRHDIVSEDEEDDLLNICKDAFRNYGIRDAIKKVMDELESK